MIWITILNQHYAVVLTTCLITFLGGVILLSYGLSGRGGFKPRLAPLSSQKVMSEITFEIYHECYSEGKYCIKKFNVQRSYRANRVETPIPRWMS